MTPAEQKEAEANEGGLKEVKSDVSSNSSSEDIQPFQKRSRRKECIFITVAVILGAGLIAVLVYFSVTNALKEDEPVARESQAEEPTSTTPDYNAYYDYQSDNEPSGGGVNPGDIMTKNHLLTSRGGLQTRQSSGPSPGNNLRSNPSGMQTRGLIPNPSQLGGETPDSQQAGPMLRRMPSPSTETGEETEEAETDPEGGQTSNSEPQMGPTLRRMVPPPAENTEVTDSEADEGEGHTSESEPPMVPSLRSIRPSPPDSGALDGGTDNDDKEEVERVVDPAVPSVMKEDSSAATDDSPLPSVDRSSFLRKPMRPQQKEEPTEN